MENYLYNSNNFRNFGAWIGGSCKPSDKGTLTAFPRFKICQHNFINVSSMLKFEELPKVNSPRWLSLEDLPGEVWKDVEGYEKKLQISIYGRLKCKEYIGWHTVSKETRHKARIYRLMKTGYGYWQIGPYLDGKKHNFLIHREVAKAFIDNPDNLPFINHIDENPKNNCVYNLEWCTPKHNTTWGTAIERKIKTQKEMGLYRPVVLYDYEGNVLEEFESIADAERKYNARGLVSLCCNGKCVTARGMHFRFKGDVYKKREIGNMKAKYTLINPNGEIEEYLGAFPFSKAIGLNSANISSLVNGSIKYSKTLKDKLIRIDYCDGRSYLIENGVLKDLNKKE